MKPTELIWERVGFGILGAAVGAVYGLAVSLVIVLLLKKMTFGFMLKVFCSVFGVAGVLMGKSIEGVVMSSAYTIYFLWGAFLGAIGGEGALTQEAASLAPRKGAALYIVALGAISVSWNTPAGSYTYTDPPSAARARTVRSNTSKRIDVATTGPAQDSTVGTTMPRVFQLR